MHICAGGFTVQCWENTLQSFVCALPLFCFSEQPMYLWVYLIIENSSVFQKSVCQQATSFVCGKTVT